MEISWFFYHTDFTSNQIWGSRSAKSAILHMYLFSCPAVLEFLDYPKLISCKIWMTEKLLNFYTVLYVILTSMDDFKVLEAKWILVESTIELWFSGKLGTYCLAKLVG